MVELVTIVSLEIYSWLFAKPNKQSCYVSLPTQKAPSNSHEVLDGTVGAEDHVGDLLLSKWTHRSRPSLSNRTLFCGNLTRHLSILDGAVDVCRLTNAANAAILIIGPISAH